MRTKYKEDWKKDPQGRSKSSDNISVPTWQKPVPDEVDVDILEALIEGNVPFTEDFLPAELPAEEKIFAEELKDRWAEPFKEPEEPSLGHFNNDYL